MPDTDPNQVRLTGENSFIRLHREQDGPQLTRVSHWRILYSPGGPGHVLFIQSDVTDHAVRIYTDNIAMTRWLQGEIESLLYPPFANQEQPVIAAEFSRRGDTQAFRVARMGCIAASYRPGAPRLPSMAVLLPGGQLRPNGMRMTVAAPVWRCQ